MANQSSFSRKRLSNLNSRSQGNRTDFSETGPEQNKANQNSFSPKMPSTANSRIKKNQRDDSDINFEGHQF